MLYKCYINIKISSLNVFFLVAVMKLITAVLIFFNWSSFNKCSPSNSVIVPLKVVLFELKIPYILLSLVYVVLHQRFCNAGEDERDFP